MSDHKNGLVLSQLRAMQDDSGHVKNRLATVEAISAITAIALQHCAHLTDSILPLRWDLNVKPQTFGALAA